MIEMILTEVSKRRSEFVILENFVGFSFLRKIDKFGGEFFLHLQEWYQQGEIPNQKG